MQNDETVRYVKLRVWTRRDSDGEEWTVYKLPDGSEYRGNVYGRVNDSGAE